MKAKLKVFVYGTTKDDLRDLNRISEGAVLVEQATVRGRLLELPTEASVLDVPGVDILAVGTLDPLADADTQQRFIEPFQVPLSGEFGQWQDIDGKLLTFEDAAACLEMLDRMKGFCPYFADMHRRVLLPVVTADGKPTAAWCYVVGALLTSCVLTSDKTCCS